MKTLKNLYDSHVHFVATGQAACEWDLSRLTSREDLKTLKPVAENFRGEWLVGFGWDENKWPDPRVWTLAELDAVFASTPVYFSRCDGHSAVVNSEGLRRLGLPASATRLFETDHYRAYEKLPAPSDADVMNYMHRAMKIFNEAGFTHIRDMGGVLAHWRLACELERAGQQTLAVEWNFVAEDLANFDRIVEDALYVRAHETPLNRLAGVKFYYDGSLGSETALLSKPYANRPETSGMACWPREQITECIRKAWLAGLPVAVHAIGDEAADHMVECARAVSGTGIGGHLHLEHAELLRPETIQKMKGLHVICHMQPCHWHTDRRWLKAKTGTLAGFAFQWEALRRSRIPFCFGSDSPIEKPSLFSNLLALEGSAAEGVPALGGDPLAFHVLAKTKAPSGETTVDFAQRKIIEVRLGDRIVYQAPDRH